MNLRFWRRAPSREIEALRSAYEEAKLAMRYHIQNLEAQNRDLQAKLLELLEPGITARLAPRPQRALRPVEEPAAQLAAKLRSTPVPLPGYDPPEMEES